MSGERERERKRERKREGEKEKKKWWIQQMREDEMNSTKAG
jgi:hypothetical protein